jgi:hypothetical protein
MIALISRGIGIAYINHQLDERITMNHAVLIIVY